MKHKRRVVMAVILVATLLVSLFGTATVSQAVDPKAQAIADGLAYLAAAQDDSGAWDLGYFPATGTAIAVTKLCEHAKKTRDPIVDPIDDDWEYRDNVLKGLDYLLAHAYAMPIGPQPAGDPDVNKPNGQGIYFASSPGGSQRGYETGFGMLALQASCHPDRVVDVPGSAVDGWTYLEVMKDCVDWVAFAQQDTGSGRGGWRYRENMGSSDNSVSQWPVLGLISAAAPGWDIDAPAWVRTELEDHWLAYSQNVSGMFGYGGPTGGSPMAMTGSGLIQLTYCGVPTTDSRWDDARTYIGNNWTAVGCYYDMYAIMKAAMILTAPIQYFGAIDWQLEYDAWLIANQNGDGSWGPGCRGYSHVLATCWALLILQKAAPPPPPPPSVPGMTGWGIMAAAILLAGLIPVALRRRKSLISSP